VPEESFSFGGMTRFVVGRARGGGCGRAGGGSDCFFVGRYWERFVLIGLLIGHDDCGEGGSGLWEESWDSAF
jgi:hypothetical protein